MKIQENQLIERFEQYLELNKIDDIKKELPLLLKSYSKTKKRMDRILNQSDNQQLKVLKLTEILENTNTKVKEL
jgi:hypothetical protein